jgi:Flp pilus assembly protein TadG
MRNRFRPRRRAATAVETAVVLSAALLFLFGIFEYCRFIFLIQVCENAAREGARYAIAHTGDGTTDTDIRNFVTAKMVGRQIELTGYTVDVMAANPTTGTQVPGSNWNDAKFGEVILVRVNGTYNPMLPSFLKGPTSIQIRTTSMMTSEAN